MVRLALTAGQAGDAPAAEYPLADLSPVATLIADRAYDTSAIQDFVADRGAWANIPLRSIRKDAFSFRDWVYRQRNLVKRFFNHVNQFLGLATRYDRRPDKFLAAIKLAAIRIWIARNEHAF